jgi:hypothetical protein
MAVVITRTADAGASDAGITVKSLRKLCGKTQWRRPAIM